MKQILKLLSGLILLSITGCNIDKPSPGYIYMWERPRADFTEVGKALLECGMPSPYDADPETQKLTPNDMVAIDACMVQSGFRNKNRVEGGGVILLKKTTFPYVVLVLSCLSAVLRDA